MSDYIEKLLDDDEVLLFKKIMNESDNEEVLKEIIKIKDESEDD